MILETYWFLFVIIFSSTWIYIEMDIHKRVIKWWRFFVPPVLTNWKEIILYTYELYLNISQFLKKNCFFFQMFVYLGLRITAIHLKKTDKCLISGFCKINIEYMISSRVLLIRYVIIKLYVEFIHRKISWLCIEFWQQSSPFMILNLR